MAAAISSDARKKVLIVEDDEATARMLARFLRDFDVTIARDGGEGLERAIALRPDVVICDLWMPRVNGIEMVRELKSDHFLRAVPVIFVTAAANAQNVAAAITAGARHLLSKPIQVKNLLDVVHRALR